MVSGVGFKSTTDDEQEGAPRKKMVSRGLVIAFSFLVLVIVIYGLLKLWHGSLVSQSRDLDSRTTQINLDIQKSLAASDVADFASRADVMQNDLYRGYDTNDVLNEIQKIMILKEGGPRVVLKSFEHNAGASEKKTNGNVSSVITGRGNVTISADADTFDVMAQQIEVFKKSDIFDNVVVGTTDRDDSGRIIFTLTMDVVGYEQSPYEKNGLDALNVSEQQDDAEDVLIFDNEDGVDVTESVDDVQFEEDLNDVIIDD